jgi:hypothetical protein
MRAGGWRGWIWEEPFEEGPCRQLWPFSLFPSCTGRMGSPRRLPSPNVRLHHLLELDPCGSQHAHSTKTVSRANNRGECASGLSMTREGNLDPYLSNWRNA